MDPHGHFLCPVVRGQHTNAGLCVCTRACACTFKYGLQDLHPHGRRTCTHTRGWLLGSPLQAGAWLLLALPACPAHLPRVPGARWGRAVPETSPSCCAQFQGSHPLASCPRSLPALAPALRASRKALGGPAPSPACLSPLSKTTQRRGCATHFLLCLQSLSQNQKRLKQSRVALHVG